VNPRIIKLGVESGMLNYVDHETPRHYFLCGHADEECLERFAQSIVRECAKISEQSQWTEAKGEYYEGFNEAMIYMSNKIKEHFGVK
jgi:hypothetical protein